MIWEYYALRVYAEQIRVLQGQYTAYIDTVKRVLKKNSGHGVDLLNAEDDAPGVFDMSSPGDDEMEIDSFMVINRTPSYLKESTVSYMRDQRLEPLLNRINTHEWNNYTDQVLSAQKEPVKKSGIRTVRQPTTRYTNQRWGAQKAKHAPITGITFVLPIDHSRFWLSSFFGSRKKPNGKWGFHYGIDMAAHRGTVVKASAAGTVQQAGYVSGYGNTVVVVHDTVYKTRYAHLDKIHVLTDQKVAQGEKIGAVGDTGFTIKTGKDASHLHFELYERGKQINPLTVLSATTGKNVLH